MMKKVLVLMLVLGLVAFALVGCGDNNNNVDNNDNNDNDPVVGDATYKVGLGHINSIAKSKDADGDALAVAQADVVMAAVLFDDEDKVVSVTLDNAQTKVNFDADLQVTSDLAAPGKTKVELGDDYGMSGISEIGKEWYEQALEFEKWMVGKTVAEIKDLQVKVRDDAHQNVPDVPELTSLVTITVEDYIAAVEEAFANAIEVENAEKVGLGNNISIAKSKGYDEASDTLPVAQVDTVMAATAFDADGKVVGTVIDNAQIKINYDAEGKVTSDKTVEPKTKVELGADYGMSAISEIGKEWFEQIAAFSEWMVGKTVAEIEGLQVKVRDDAHQSVPDVPELTSTVTITVEGYQAAVAEAYANAK